MPRWLTHPTVVRACQIVTGVVLAWAGLAKIGDPASFAEQVHNFRIVPLFAENLVAMTLPWIEVVTALALLLRIRARDGAMLAAAALLVFTLAVLSALARGLDIECGCFGTADASRVGALKVAENLGFIALACVASLRASLRAGVRPERPELR